jgi:5-methylcytosine-specific restriction endonuclease McrA
MLQWRDQGTFAALVMRDGDCCHLCGMLATDFDPLEVDHIRSRADHGGHGIDNLALAHRSCNRLKGSASVTRRPR